MSGEEMQQEMERCSLARVYSIIRTDYFVLDKEACRSSGYLSVVTVDATTNPGTRRDSGTKFSMSACCESSNAADHLAARSVTPCALSST